MVAHAVMRAWQTSLGGPPPKGRVYNPGQEAKLSDCGWQRPDLEDGGGSVATFDEARAALESPLRPIDPAVEIEPATSDEDDPAIQVAKRDNIVPIRRGAVSESPAEDSLWSSHLFWKGFVIGAAIVLLVKTVIEVQAPFGIDWYGP